MSFFLGALASFAAYGLLARRLFSLREVHVACIIATILCVSGFALLHAASELTPDFVLLAISFALGIGAGVLYCLGGITQASLSHEGSLIFPTMIFFFEAIIVFLMLVLFREGIVDCVVGVLPVFTALTVIPHTNSDGEPFSSQALLKTRRSDIRSLLQSSCAMLSTDLLYGVIIGFASCDFLLFCAFLLGMVLASAFKFYDSTHKRRFEVSFIIKVQAPIACAVLLFVDVLPNPAFFVVVLGATFLTISCRIITYSAVSNYMRVFQLNPISNMSFICIVTMLGLAVGYILSTLIISSTPDVLPHESLSIILKFVVLAVVIVQAFVFKDNYRPFVEHSAMLDVDRTEKDGKDADVPRPALWKNRCRAFSDFYGLTPRQAEIMLLIAKGYSTSYIMEKLCISVHTVKAHTFAIYQKVDVHSRQKLIEEIEAFDLASWEKNHES